MKFVPSVEYSIEARSQHAPGPFCSALWYASNERITDTAEDGSASDGVSSRRSLVVSLSGTDQTVVDMPVPAGGAPCVQAVAPVPPAVQPLMPLSKSSWYSVVAVVPDGHWPGTPVVNENVAETAPSPQ